MYRTINVDQLMGLYDNSLMLTIGGTPGIFREVIKGRLKDGIADVEIIICKLTIQK